MKNIAIFASGSGTNAENIYRFFDRGNRIAVSLVIYDRKDAGVAERMRQYGVETVYIPGSVWRERPQEILNLLMLKNIDLVVLAGFLRMVPDVITSAYAGRILNIHPSLLPAYGGKGMYGHHVHQAVIANRETKSGVTVHYVTPECDGGEILMQQEVSITPDDTPETLEAKIHPVEYDIYPRAIVAALSRLDNAPAIPTSQQPGGNAPSPDAPTVSVQADATTPPPVPRSGRTAAEEWADALHIQYTPGQQPPAYHSNPELPPAPAGAPNQPAGSRYTAPGVNPADMPPTNLVWAVIVTVLCCTIPGIVAIIMSSKVSSRYYAGDIEGAKRASTAVEWWVIISFILGILSATLYL
ncbi:MAG: CD225/dispanin family protein, partial [Muribaculaceae bacterium]|nr:CD225/dispanin family protein [Muribaculaceae bacterium]